MRPFGPFSDGSDPSSGPKACVVMIGPMTLTSIWRRNSSAASSSTGPATAMPALLTRPNSVSPLSAARTWRAAANTVASSVTSNNSGMKLAPNSRFSRSASTSLRTLPNTRNPRSSSSFAVAQPIPVEAPVMTTDCIIGPFNILANGLFDLARRDNAKGQNPASPWKQLSEPQIFTRELADRSAAHQPHSPLDLRPHQAKGPLNAGLTGRRERIEIKAPDSNGFGSERERLQDVVAALDSSVHDHVDAIPDRIHDFSQLIECRARAVELPPAMIGQHDAGAAYLTCAFRICHRHNSLQTKLTVPQLNHFGHVVPVHGGGQHLGEILADRQRPAAHVDVLVQLGQFEALMRDVVDAPQRLDRELPHPANRQP